MGVDTTPFESVAKPPAARKSQPPSAPSGEVDEPYVTPPAPVAPKPEGAVVKPTTKKQKAAQRPKRSGVDIRLPQNWRSVDFGVLICHVRSLHPEIRVRTDEPSHGWQAWEKRRLIAWLLDDEAQVGGRAIQPHQARDRYSPIKDEKPNATEQKHAKGNRPVPKPHTEGERIKAAADEVIAALRKKAAAELKKLEQAGQEATNLLAQVGRASATLPGAISGILKTFEEKAQQREAQGSADVIERLNTLAEQVAQLIEAVARLTERDAPSEALAEPKKAALSDGQQKAPRRLVGNWKAWSEERVLKALHDEGCAATRLPRGWRYLSADQLRSMCKTS